MDVEAYYIIIENGVADKITLIPSTQTKKYLNLGRKWRLDTFGSIDTDIVKSLNVFERKSMAKSKSWNPLDPSAIALALDPSLAVQIRLTNTSVYLCGNSRGRTTNNFQSKSPNAKLIFSANKSAYRDFLYKTFSADISNINNQAHVCNDISTGNDYTTSHDELDDDDNSRNVDML